MLKYEDIKLIHGSGGQVMSQLINELIVKRVKLPNVSGGIGLKQLDDGASIPLKTGEIVLTSDSYTVEPIFFPGGNIGVLAVCGTINDLAMMGAKPLALMDTIVVEEGFPIASLEKIVDSMISLTTENEIALIGGDFKVMPKGKLDKVVISTFGVGLADRGKLLMDSALKPGDKIIFTGSIGDHEIALISVREGISFESEISSDVAPLWPIIQAALNVGGVHTAKDPTRGGLAEALNELAKKSNVSIWISESNLNLKPEVRAACEMLGLDPLHLACEGRAVIGVSQEKADEVLEAIHKIDNGDTATIIGEVHNENPGYVILETTIGGKRIISPPMGAPLPRVC